MPVHTRSVVVDASNRLWILDTAAPKFSTPIEGAAKLVAVDLATDKVVKTIVFPRSTVLSTTYVNDVRFDLREGKEGVAYITDSSVSGPGGIIVVDLASGESWRKLTGHPSTSPDPTFIPIVEGERLANREHGKAPAPFNVASDGVALSPDGKTLYYCPLSSRHLYSVPTSLLLDRGANEAALDKAVVDLGEKGASDRLESDSKGRVYAGDYEHNGKRDITGITENCANRAFEAFFTTKASGMGMPRLVRPLASISQLRRRQQCDQVVVRDRDYRKF